MSATTSGRVLAGRTTAERVRGSFLFLLSVHTERRKYLNVNQIFNLRKSNHQFQTKTSMARVENFSNITMLMTVGR